MTAIDTAMVRKALIGLPEETSYGGTPDPKWVYLPRSHLKAMNLDVALVTGMRGAGKTFWWSALRQPGVRRLIGAADPRSALSENTEVCTGFGAAPAPDDYPGINVFPRLMRDAEPKAVWRTVLARHLAPDGHPLRGEAGWRDRVAWVEAEPEAVDRLFHERDEALDRENGHFLVLFDALDRCADDRKDMYRAIRGLLQAALDVRPYRRLRVKIFLRSDQIDEAWIADFPDASKVLSSRVDLGWPRRELYGLLWHVLGNGAHGAFFREFLGGDWKPAGPNGEDAFQMPRALADEDRQREIFSDIAGRWMGANRRRGATYSWIPTHLGDTEERASPRSFLAALKEAARDTDERYPDHDRALHYDSIKQGVQKASGIRVREIREDYPWVHRALEPLRGLNVPCPFGDIEERWREGNVIDRLAREVVDDEVKLLPPQLDRGAVGVREDLESLSIFHRMYDDRVQIPDVFRVGYGLGRRGGVKPVR